MYLKESGVSLKGATMATMAVPAPNIRRTMPDAKHQMSRDSMSKDSMLFKSLAKAQMNAGSLPKSINIYICIAQILKFANPGMSQFQEFARGPGKRL